MEIKYLLGGVVVGALLGIWMHKSGQAGSSS